MPSESKTNYILIRITVIFILVLAIFFMSNNFITKELYQSDATFSNSDQVLGFAALSAVEELKQDVVIEEENNMIFDHKKINSKLYVANTFLSDVSEFTVDVQEGSSKNYDKIMIISYADMNKNVNTHEFHYNETIIEVEDDEVESLISGVIIVNGVEYTLTGTKEEEDEEYEYDLIASLDDENYITITYEVEESASEIEKEFEYERFVNKQLVYRLEIEFKVEEDGEREITIKFLDGNFESEYNFKSEIENNEEEINIEYKISESGVIIEEGEFSSYSEFNE